MIIVQANVLKSELGCTGGHPRHPRHPGYRKVPILNQNQNEKFNENYDKCDENLNLITLLFELKKNNYKKRKTNVLKAFGILLKLVKCFLSGCAWNAGNQISYFFILLKRTY